MIQRWRLFKCLSLNDQNICSFKSVFFYFSRWEFKWQNTIACPFIPAYIWQHCYQTGFYYERAAVQPMTSLELWTSLNTDQRGRGYQTHLFNYIIEFLCHSLILLYCVIHCVLWQIVLIFPMCCHIHKYNYIICWPMY